MGTNYYVAENRCDCCNRYDEKYHIGKASMGWAFSFRGYRYDRLTSWAEWKTYLIDQIIVNEYREVMPYDEFVRMIETYKSPGYEWKDGFVNLLHNSEGKTNAYPWFNSEHDWDDLLGYSFSDREFS